jgi:alpha-N-arabinofuranosidase
MDMGWTEGFYGGLQSHPRVRVDGFALHYYTDFRQTPEDGATFDEKGWYAVLHKGVRIDRIIEDHWRLMGRYDPEHHTKFVIDEWGNWYRGGTELGPAYLLSQTITLRDALHAAMTFDIFNRHADKIEMANVAQTINCLHSLFAAVEDKYTRTPAYYAFEMYQPHMGARLVPMQIGVPELTVPLLEGSAKLPGISGSASIRDRRLGVTLTNPSLDAALSVGIRLDGGGRVAEGRGTVLTHEEMTATNTFDDPDNVNLSELAVQVRGDAAHVTIPPKAVVALEVHIA